MSRVVSLSTVARQVAPTDFATASAYEDVFCEVYEGERAHIKSYSRLNAPHLPSATRQVIFSRLYYDIAPMRLFAMRNACFYGSPMFFFARETGELVEESTEHWHKEELDYETFVGKMRGRARGVIRDFYTEDGVIRPSCTLPGTYLLACSRFDNNYYHWHVDILPTVCFCRRHIQSSLAKFL